jgi:CRISPR-associated protein Cmr4
MYKNAKPLFLICETPLHVGSGSDLGIVDLPIQRERHTNFPKIESSSLKGALREAFESAFNSKTFNKPDDNDVKIHRVFGFDDGSLSEAQKTQLKTHFKNSKNEDQTQFSGALALTDARLLLFPVKSLYGVFAWITCPRVIKKFIEDLGLTDLQFTLSEVSSAMVANGSTLFGNGQKMQLEEFVFSKVNPVNTDNEVNKLGKWLSEKVFTEMGNYWKEKIKTDIVVLDDNDFRDFVTLSTEVITRTKINNATGTVQDGALFSEEYLPAESVLYSLAMFADEFSAKETKMNAANTQQFFVDGLKANNNIVQVGGNATLGKGIVKTKLV